MTWFTCWRCSFMAAALLRAGSFEAWFTHMFVLADLAGGNTSPGEALILRADHSGKPEVLARLQVQV